MNQSSEIVTPYIPEKSGFGDTVPISKHKTHDIVTTLIMRRKTTIQLDYRIYTFSGISGTGQMVIWVYKFFKYRITEKKRTQGTCSVARVEASLFARCGRGCNLFS